MLGSYVWGMSLVARGMSLVARTATNSPCIQHKDGQDQQPRQHKDGQDQQPSRDQDQISDCEDDEDDL